MPEPQLSVRSARARDLAHMLAKRERRTVAQVVEMALESYAKEHERPPLSSTEFVAQLLRRDPGDNVDVDLELLINEHRTTPRAIEIE